MEHPTVGRAQYYAAGSVLTGTMRHGVGTTKSILNLRQEINGHNTQTSKGGVLNGTPTPTLITRPLDRRGRPALPSNEPDEALFLYFEFG